MGLTLAGQHHSAKHGFVVRLGSTRANKLRPPSVPFLAKPTLTNLVARRRWYDRAALTP